MTEPLRARLTALVAEMRADPSVGTLQPPLKGTTAYWADRLAALLREPPEVEAHRYGCPHDGDPLLDPRPVDCTCPQRAAAPEEKS
jgi:hypothetical protein